MGGAPIALRRPAPPTLGLLSAAALLAACARPTPTFTPSRTPLNLSNAAPAVAWQYDAGQPLTARVAAGHGLVLLAPGGEALVALEAETGREKWRYPGRVHPGSLLIAEALVFAGAPGGALLALEVETGALRWEARLIGDLIYPPAVVDGMLYAGTAFVGPGLTAQPEKAGRLYARRARDGEPAWEQVTECYLLASPVVDADLLVAGGSFLGPPVDEGGHLRLMALRPADGESVWQRDSEDGLLKSLALDGERLYYLAYRDVVVALDRRSGAPLWTYDTENWSPGMVLADGHLYFGSDNAFVHALAGVDGARQWRVRLAGTFNAPRGAPLAAAGRLYFQGADRSLYALDQATGAVVWQTPPQAFSRVNLTLAEDQDQLYLAGADGVVYAYRLAP